MIIRGTINFGACLTLYIRLFYKHCLILFKHHTAQDGLTSRNSSLQLPQVTFRSYNSASEQFSHRHMLPLPLVPGLTGKEIQ